MKCGKWIGALAVAGLSVSASAQNVLVQIHGAQSGSRLGASIARLSDIDGDGVPELAIGSMGDLKIAVVSGATGKTLYSVSSGVWSNFGERVRAIGDADGDGLIDFIAPSWTENSYDGAVRVYSGANGALLYEIHGANGARLGRDADGVGDVDGDGRADFIVGADGEQNIGVAHVYSGATGAEIWNIPASVWGGLDLGAGVGGLGDIDGDGWPDFAVGIPAGGAPGGHVLVFSGRTATLLYTFGEPSLSNWTYARTIVSIGDVDGDGVPDIAVGDSNFSAYDGSVLVYSGANGAFLYRVFGSGCFGDGAGGSDPDFGTEIAAIGDLDGDGIGDFAVGGLNEARAFSGATGSLLREFHEPPVFFSGDVHCVGVHSVPDLNGDGRPEVVVGWQLAPGALGPYSGRVTWYADDVYPPAGNLLALGDGSGLPCPCGNTGQVGAGCANSTGFGAELRAWGSTSLAQSTLYFELSHTPPNAMALVYCGTLAANGGLGVPFGDGLRGAGGLTKRFHPYHTCSDGRFIWGPSLEFQAGWGAGDTRVFQAWYRNPGGPCGSTFNFSNAVRVTLAP